MTERRRRTAGVDLRDADVFAVLNDHVPVGQCRPKELFKLSAIKKDGHSSEWQIFKKNHGLLNDILDLSDGRIPRQKTFTLQLGGWLKEKGMQWGIKDIERSASDLRCMLLNLLALKRRPGGCAPKGYPTLQILMDKLSLEECTTLGDRDDKEPNKKRYHSDDEPDDESIVDRETVAELKRQRGDSSRGEGLPDESGDNEIDELTEELFRNNESASSGSGSSGSVEPSAQVPSPFKGFVMKAASRPSSWTSPQATPSATACTRRRPPSTKRPSAATPSAGAQASSPSSSTPEPTREAPSGATLLDATRLEQLSRLGDGDIGPTPAQYKDLNKEIKGKGGKVNCRPAASSKVVGRGGRAARDQADDADWKAAMMAKIGDDDPIKDYLDVKALGVPIAVVRERVRAKAYHTMRGKCLSEGMDPDKAKERAGDWGRFHVARWTEKVGVA